jgi:uncharacterized protein (TIRG00374 family)
VLIILGGFMVNIVQGASLPVNIWYVRFVVIYALLNILLFSLVIRPKTLIKLYEKSPGWVKRNLFEKLYKSQTDSGGFQRFVDEVGKSLKLLSSNIGLNLLSIFFVAFHWSTGSLTSYLVALSLGYNIDFWVIILIYAVVEFIQQLNIVIPSGLGIIDAGLTGAFVVVGVPLNSASAISLLTRLATYWFELILCALVSFQYGYRKVIRDL